MFTNNFLYDVTVPLRNKEPYLVFALIMIVDMGFLNELGDFLYSIPIILTMAIIN